MTLGYSSATFDVAVIGAGPAGCSAAISASKITRSVILIERNAQIGKKLLLTGKGRCNLTNAASLEQFIDKFGKNGLFLREAFSAFFNEELVNFFRSMGLDLKVERQGRVFPITDKSVSVVEALERALKKNKVRILYGRRLHDITRTAGAFSLKFLNHPEIAAKKVVLATGGISYKATGSSGDGFRIAAKLGHKIMPLRPALVPICVEEQWVKSLAGLTLRNVRLRVKYNDRHFESEIGELLFTHFGVSGPLVLDMSAKIVDLLSEFKKMKLCIDLKPALSAQKIEERLLSEIKGQGRTKVKNLMRLWLPLKLIDIFMRLSGINQDVHTNQLKKEGRTAVINLLKGLPLTLTGPLPIEEAMVTAGGVSLKQIDPRTMESRIVSGLYFAGEIIDAAAPSGGYNLQAAFSTGYLAGKGGQMNPAVLLCKTSSG